MKGRALCGTCGAEGALRNDGYRIRHLNRRDGGICAGSHELPMVSAVPVPADGLPHHVAWVCDGEGITISVDGQRVQSGAA